MNFLFEQIKISARKSLPCKRTFSHVALTKGWVHTTPYSDTKLTKPFFSDRSDRHIPSKSVSIARACVFPLLPRHMRYFLSTSPCLLYSCSLNEVTKTCSPDMYNRSSFPFQQQEQQHKRTKGWRGRGWGESKAIMAIWNPYTCI